MKKLLVVTALVLSSMLLSCEQKLPTIIENEVLNVERYVKICEPFDSLMVSLSKDDIDKMTEDSLSTLRIRYEVYKDGDKLAKEKLDELLKYSPEYSDHPKIKNIKRRQYSNLNLYFKNITYISNRIDLLQDKKYNLKLYKGVDYENQTIIR
jgi:hypothetical protein